MQIADSKINIFALTDCHQEARKLCCLLSEIIARTPNNGANTLVCDGGDLFKGIYSRELCVNSYLHLRQKLPNAKIVIAAGNNDFGFNSAEFNFYKETVSRFNQANIDVLCANLRDEKNAFPNWIKPYAVLEINHRKIMVMAFCTNQYRLQRYGLQLLDIEQTFMDLVPQIKHISPDAIVILNHALVPKSISLAATAKKAGISVDLIIGGHEHSVVMPIPEQHIYYPQAYARNMLQFALDFKDNLPNLEFVASLDCKTCPINPDLKKPLDDYENDTGLNVPVAPSILNLERDYSNPSPIGTFITDKMRDIAAADIGIISTGFICHALRFEAGKILTYYNIERAFSADIPLQTVTVSALQLKAMFNNALRNRYVSYAGNTRFLQCSQNVAIDCIKLADNTGSVKQIYINGIALLDDYGQPLHSEETYVCAIDPFIGSGELGFDVLRSLPKETLLQHNQLVKIKDLFFDELIAAAAKYAPGSSYPVYKLRDL